MPTAPPGPATAMFGHEAASAEVGALLARHRVVTLTGSGGCGKTRLALDVAATPQAAAGRDVVWVDLAALSDPALIPQTVTFALGLPGRASEDLVPALRSALAEREVLLLLDNCEHLVAAAAELVEVLPCAVLATSRESLGVAGEVVFRVRSLSTPAAVALFLDRAGAVRPGWAPDRDELLAVEEICTRLDGIPLALELAAARMRMLTATQIAEQLQRRFQLLSGGVRSAVPRQRTLEASIGWSHDLLEQTEATVFRRLSVFRGSFDLAAAAEVSGLGEDVLDPLTALIDRSLLDVTVRDRQARYRMLETVREFAQAKLNAGGDADQTRGRHLRQVLARAEAREPRFAGPDLLALLAEADDDQPDVRAAMDWATVGGHPELALRLAGCHWMYWSLRTRHSEGRARLEEALQAGADAPPLVRFKALLAVLMLCLGRDLRAAAVFAQETVELADLTGLEALRSQALAWRGQVNALLNREPDGLADLEESLRLARHAGDPAHLARSLQWLGTVVGETGAITRAIALLDESIALARRTGNDLQLGWALTWRARAATNAGQAEEAIRAATESVQVLQDRGELFFLPMPWTFLSYAHSLFGSGREAVEAAQQALAAADRSPTPMMQASSALAHGLTCWIGEDLAAAEETLRRALTSFTDCGVIVLSANVQAFLGRLAAQQGRPQEAREHYREALARGSRIHAAFCQTQIGLSHLSLAEGHPAQALTQAREALDRGLTSGHTILAIDALTALAEACWALDAEADAARALGAAQAARERLGYTGLPDLAQRVAPLLVLVSESPDFEAGRQHPLEEVAGSLGRGRGPRGRPANGWASLTPTELEVARLIAEGLSNPQVAAALFVTRNTVKAHLVHIYTKLGISTRAALAAEATRHLTQVQG